MQNDRPFIRWCNVYLHLTSEQAVVAQCFNHAGLQAEVPGGARLIEASNEEDLGRDVLLALHSCVWEPTFNYRNSKRSDWPAFLASGEPKIAKFEKQWRRFGVAGANASNIVWQLSVVLKEEHSLTLTATVSQAHDPSRLGAALRFLDAEAGRFLVES